MAPASESVTVGVFARVVAQEVERGRCAVAAEFIDQRCVGVLAAAAGWTEPSFLDPSRTAGLVSPSSDGALWLHNFYPTGEQWYTNFKPQSGWLCSTLSKLHHILTLFRDAGERPDVWFEPEEVWEIRGADLSLSPVRVLKGWRERGGHTWLFFLPALCAACLQST